MASSNYYTFFRDACVKPSLCRVKAALCLLIIMSRKARQKYACSDPPQPLIKV